MIVVDVNLLLYAVIDGFPQHPKARSWWEKALNGPTQVGLSSPAIFGFLRIATNRRILAEPLSADGAISYVEDWLAEPHVIFLQPGPRHLDITFGLLRSAGTAANLTTDAQLAALAIEHGAQVYSSDTDFGRFAELRWVNPLH